MRRYLAELVGTFLVVFVAAGAVVADVYLTHTRLADTFGPFGLIVAYGAAVAVAMLIVLPVSGGHLNPAISIAAYVSKRLSGKDAVAFVLAQLAGAVVAGLVVRGLMPKSAFQFASGGVPALGEGISVLRGAGIEAVLTFFLALAFWAVCIDRRGPRAAALLIGPLTVGLAIAMGGFAGAAFTGGAMNPARWFGPAVASNHYANWLVWVAGPLLGALVGSLLYEALFVGGPGTTEEAEAEEDEVEEPAPVWTASPPKGEPRPAEGPAEGPGEGHAEVPGGGPDEGDAPEA